MAHSEKTVIYLHIPKTAGTTLRTIMRKQYRPEHARFLEPDPHIKDTIAQFSTVDNAEKSAIRLLAGNFDFGIHHTLPQPSTYFTLLRDPIERVISYYYFILRSPAHPRYEEMTARNTSLKEFATKILAWNEQTRILAGIWLDEKQPCTQETLAVAKQNLQTHFIVVGLTEKFDTTLFLLQKRLRWQTIPVTYRRNNVTPNRPTIHDFAPDVREAIIQANQLDFVLYAYAKSLFRQRIREQGALFRLQLLLFHLRRWSHIYYWEFRRHSIRTYMRQWLRP